MGAVSGVVVFLLIWWTSLFAVLPFAGKRDENGIPQKANIKKKLIANTIITIILWGMIFAFIEADIISFREMAEEIAKSQKV